MKGSRRFTVFTMLAAGLLATAAHPTVASAAEIRMRLGWNPPNAEHPYAVAGNAFKKLVEDGSKGEIKVQTFCCFKMGSEEEMVKKLQAGTLDGVIVAQNNIGPFFPLIDLFVLPYVFRDHDHAVKVLAGPVGREMSEKAAAKAGFHLYSSASIAFRNIYNTRRPIESIKDVAGLRYRVPPNPIAIATYKAFGAEPTPLPWGETLTATQTGIVDGGDLEPTGFLLNGFAEVAKNMAWTEHFTLIAPLMISDRFLQKLTPEQRQLVEKAALDATKAGQDAELALDKTIKGKLETMGVAFTYPDKAPFVAASAEVRAEFVKERGPEAAKLLEEIETTR